MADLEGMEALILEASTRPHMQSLDYRGLRSHREVLEPTTAKHLVNFLLSKTGLKTDSVVRPVLTREAQNALKTFFFFIKDDKAFQVEFQRLRVRHVSKRLKLERHILEGPEEPQHKVCTDCLFNSVFFLFVFNL